MSSAGANPHGLADPDPTGRSRLVFHYTSRSGLRGILEDGSIRLGLLTSTNDPRERREWLAGEVVHFAGHPNGTPPTASQIALAGETDRMLRRGGRVACFTLDGEPHSDAERTSLFRRGWGRARMWSQYAADHQGAVLAFDKDALTSPKALGSLGTTEDDIHAVGEVRYRNGPLRVELGSDVGTIEAVREAMRRGNLDANEFADVFYVKNSDWASETEYRIAVCIWDPDESRKVEALHLPFSDALRAVIVGERFDGADWLTPAVDARGLDPGHVVRCDWVAGAPTLRGYELR